MGNVVNLAAHLHPRAEADNAGEERLLWPRKAKTPITTKA